MSATEKLSAERRTEIATKLGIAPAALWCWKDSQLLRAEANGIRHTSTGAAINSAPVSK